MRSKEKNEGLSKLLGGKWKEEQKKLLLFIPLASKHWKVFFFFPLAFKHWKLIPLLPLATKLGTFHWPPSFGSTFNSLLFFFKRRFGSLGALFFLDIIFNSNLEIFCFQNLLGEENNE